MSTPRRTTPSPGYLTLAEAADFLACDEHTLRRRIAEGKLAGYRIGPRGTRVKLADVEALVERIPTAGADR
jgi:excisionase family DNA binding protein